MNAVVALCHFCESHGPSILFCTQGLRTENAQAPVDSDCQNGSEWYNNYGANLKSPAGSTSSEVSPSTPRRSSDLCEACRSIPPGQSGFVSHDTESQIRYISTQYPEHPRLFSTVRQACVRSLSCEVCPGREGPIFFGDEHRGHVFSHTFFLKDSRSRGFHRWYSIIVVMKDQIYLLNSWPFLVSNICTIIEELQAKAGRVYRLEHAEHPGRAERLQAVSSSTFRLFRGGNKMFRSLLDLTNDPNLFKHLHMTFVWLLKACGNRLQEKILEGPPTEDSLYDWEKKQELDEEFEEGFVKVTARPTSKKEEAVVEPSAPVKWEDLNNDAPEFKSLKHIRQVLGKDYFHNLLHHILIGNQVIIRCDNGKTVASAFNLLKKLLPVGCCRVIEYSSVYEDSWRSNLLGLPRSVQLPEHVTASDLHVLLEIVSPSQSLPTPMIVEVPHQDSFYDYGVVLSTGGPLPEKIPTVLKKIENAVGNPNLGDEVVDAMITSLKEEWMNKAKVLYKFSRAESRCKEATEKLLNVLEVQDGDEQTLKFWMTGLSFQHKSHLLTSSLGTSQGFTSST